jgi:hypothetical protein
MVPGLPNIILSGSAHLEFRDPLFDMILSECSITPKAGGYPYILKHIFQCLKHLAQSNRQGAIAEFGAFQCGTTVFMAKVLQRFGSTATIYAFDTFAGFPHRRSVLDLFVDEKYAANDLERTLAYCRDYNIVLVPGDISETYLSIKAIPLMFTFFDTDNYSPTKVALKLCYEQTVEGGMIAFDHYYSPDWPQTVGERIAAKDILADTNLFHLHGTGIFLKT